MQNLKLKNNKATKKTSGRRASINLLSQIKGVPEFLIRIAQNSGLKIPEMQFIPKYRND